MRKALLIILGIFCIASLFAEPFIKEEYAITCTNCDFVCPDTSSDYGEAWCEFHDWLVKHKYIPE